MIEKRFEYYNHKGADYILDTPNKSLDFIEMLGDCLEAEEIVELLNKLNDENEELKKENKQLHQKIFEQRTKDAHDITTISNQIFTLKEFSNEMEKW